MANKPAFGTAEANRERVRDQLNAVIHEVSRVIRGKREIIRDVLTAMVAGGHVLLEDVPGVGKTTLAKTMARALNLTFSRIQFTSDLLPSDIVGVQVYRRTKEIFEFEQGPIFSQLVLADEINRTTPKTQSSLLEAMNEGTVSVYKQTHKLPEPFTVIATQNPLDFQGTYPLPESQLDRFMFRLSIGYPDQSVEHEILAAADKSVQLDEIRPAQSTTLISDAHDCLSGVLVSDIVRDYLLRIVLATRTHPEVKVGISTRAAVAYQRAVKARAFLDGRDFVTPDDVKGLAQCTLGHRIKLRDRTTSLSHGDESQRVLMNILNAVDPPL